MNNGRYNTLEFKQKQAETIDKRFGSIAEYKKICQSCNKEFTFKGRLKTKKFEDAKFCSRSCANNRQTTWDIKIKNGESNGKFVRYREVAFRNHGAKCVVCGFDKIVDVHHLDHNRDNNTKENLIPLCPNHHLMIHRSKFATEVLDAIKNYINGLLV